MRVRISGGPQPVHDEGRSHLLTWSKAYSSVEQLGNTKFLITKRRIIEKPYPSSKPPLLWMQQADLLCRYTVSANRPSRWVPALIPLNLLSLNKNELPVLLLSTLLGPRAYPGSLAQPFWPLPGDRSFLQQLKGDLSITVGGQFYKGDFRKLSTCRQGSKDATWRRKNPPPPSPSEGHRQVALTIPWLWGKAIHSSDGTALVTLPWPVGQRAQSRSQDSAFWSNIDSPRNPEPLRPPLRM
jgi:hypothetical protein